MASSRYKTLIFTLEFYDAFEAENAFRYLANMNYEVSLHDRVAHFLNVHLNDSGAGAYFIAEEVGRALDKAGYRWDWV